MTKRLCHPTIVLF